MSAAAQKLKKKPGNDFFCRVKFSNALPPVPFDPALLNRDDGDASVNSGTGGAAGGDVLARYCRYGCMGYERRLRFEMHPPDADLAMPAEKACLAAESPASVLDPQDERLLLNPKNAQALADAASIGPSLSIPTQKQQRSAWMRVGGVGGVGGVGDKDSRSGGTGGGDGGAGASTGSIRKRPSLPAPSKPRLSIAALESRDSDMSREAQVAAIEKSFRDVSENTLTARLRHPRKPHLTPVEVLPLFPEFNLKENKYAMLSFDKLPNEEEEKAIMEEHAALQDEAGEAAGAGAKALEPPTLPSMHPLLLPMSGASGIVMSYFKPKAETLQRLAARKRMREQDDEDEEDPGAVDEYQWQTDYRHESLEDSPSLAIAISSQGAFWLPLATRAVLRKRPKTKYDMFHEYSEIRVTTKDVEENLADGNEEGSVP